jgi:hypothetical protein
MDTDRSARLTAYRGVKAETAELRGTKLHEAEAAVIDQAAEDLLLAAGPDDAHARESYAAFVTLMDDLLDHRWAEHHATADRLDELMLACGPSVPAGVR